MRSLLLSIFTSLIFSASAVSGDYGETLGRRVRAGGVDYSGWRQSTADRQVLREFTDEAAAADLTGRSKEEKIAFLINAYNAWMLRLVLESDPVASVKDLAPDFGVFSRPLIKVAGRKMSLNDLEKGWLLKEFGDPRVHFAVNCASRSCPPLRPELWNAETLDKDLDAAARKFLTANPLGFDEAGGRVSQIFDWYASDFGGPEGVRKFLAKYRAVPPRLTFLPYDWSLNSNP